MPPPDPAPASPERDAELALAAACASGDEAAWESFYAAYHPLVLRAGERAAQGWGVADPAAIAPDVAADLFAHLRVLARRRAGRLLRKRFPQELEEDFEAPAGGASPSEVAQVSERQTLVRAQLAKLPARDRLALQLFYEGDKSYQEVAAVLDLPVNRIGTLLARARARLAKILGGED